jgi:toxin FitB
MQLVDTNVVSELVKREPNQGVIDWLARSQVVSSVLTVSAISIDEISYGVNRRPTPKLIAWFDQFMATHTVLPITAEIANRAGQLRAHFEVRGIQRSYADMLIAATAQNHGLTIVTRNVKDFDDCGVALLNPFSSHPKTKCRR